MSDHSRYCDYRHNSISECNKKLFEIEKLKQENAILREALAVYANKHNWEYDDKSKEHCIFSPVGYNFDLCSELAQKALEQTK